MISIRIAIAYIFSIVALQSPIDMIKLLGIITIVIGVLAVSGVFNFDLSGFKLEWLKWAFAASLLFAGLIICVRYATDGGVGAEVATVVVLMIAGTLFFASAIANKHSLKVRQEHLGLIGIVIVVAAIGNAANFLAFRLAPNLAYAIAIDNTRIIILYIVGMLLFSEQFRKLKTFGVVLTFIGIILMS